MLFKFKKQLKDLWDCQEGKMNDFLGTNLGILLGSGLLGWAIISGSKATKFFYNPEGIAIVLGGIIAATLTSFPLSEVFGVLKSFRMVFFSTSQESDFANTTITDAVETSLNSYKSDFDFKDNINECAKQVSHPFFRDCLSLIGAGYTEEMIAESMETSIANRNIREMEQVKILRAMGEYAPTFGVIGTLIGLIQMMASLKSNLSNVGEGLAVAFITTFYGALVANMIFHPMAEKLDSRRVKNISHLKMMLAAALLIQKKHHPRYIEANLNSFMTPKERYARFNGEKYAGKPRIAVSGKASVKKKATSKKISDFDDDDIF